MSAAASWSYTAPATLWALQSRADWNGALTFASPVQILCDYKAEAKVRTDARGREYTSRLSIYTERAGIKQGDRILIGTSTSPDPVQAGADEVMDVARFGDTLDRVADDYVISC